MQPLRSNLSILHFIILHFHLTFAVLSQNRRAWWPAGNRNLAWFSTGAFVNVKKQKHETYISTASQTPQDRTRVPQAYGNGQRPQGAGQPPR
jgi:hypothetical protein